MRNFILLSICCLLFPAAALRGEEPVIKRERVFTGDGLYGFMNGGADLFLEYGVRSLLNRELSYKEEDYTVDVYELPTPEDAYGIYSMHVFRCHQADTLGRINCTSPYQLLAATGNFYLSIVFPSGSFRAQTNAAELIPLHITADKSIKPDFPPACITALSGLPISGNIKYVRGPIAVSSASSDLASILQNVAYKDVWFIRDRKDRSYRAIIQFTSQTDKDLFKESVDAADITAEDTNSLSIHRNEKKEEPRTSSPFGF
jgi:hypothetical protein